MFLKHLIQENVFFQVLLAVEKIGSQHGRFLRKIANFFVQKGENHIQ
jgi:hypothetical protein